MTPVYLFTNVQSGDIEASTDPDAFDREHWHREEYVPKAELDEPRAAAAQKTLIESLEAQRADLGALVAKAREAVDTLESERQANAVLTAEVDRLNAAIRYEQHREGRIGTHGAGCYAWGPAHYECAMRELGAVRDERDSVLARAERVRDQALEEAAKVYELETANWKARPQAGAARRKGAAAIRAMKEQSK